MSGESPDVQIGRTQDGLWRVEAKALELAGVGATIGEAMQAFRTLALDGNQFRRDAATAAAPAPASPECEAALAAAEDIAEGIVFSEMADEAEAEDAESTPWDTVRAELDL